MNCFHTLKEYGQEIFTRKKRLKECFFRTTYFFRKIKQLLEDMTHGREYAFSFQMQSLFDGNSGRFPHFIYTDHTHLANLNYSHFDERKLFSKDWIELEKTVYHNAAVVFTRSTNITKSLINQYSCESQNIACVYAGSNVSITDTNVTEKNYANKSILFVGIDWDRKGGPTLLEAFRIVQKTHPDATLTIAGCKPNIDGLSGCNALGRAPLETVRGLFEAASIFCMPTTQEPFGVVFVEAMTYGLPVVATDIGAIPDMVQDGENGYLLNPGDAKGIAQKLCYLIENPEICRQFGKRGREIALERYNWKNVANSMRGHIIDAISR